LFTEKRKRSWCKEDIEQSLRSVENQEKDLVCAHDLLDASSLFAEGASTLFTQVSRRRRVLGR
jgi:aminoglycoside N3'-acetyltransferase